MTPEPPIEYKQPLYPITTESSSRATCILWSLLGLTSPFKEYYSREFKIDLESEPPTMYNFY